MFLDNALAFDASTRRCDLVFDGVDLTLDATAATPMLIQLLCNRRARADDTLPQAESDYYTPNSLLARQGWVGDALDAAGQLIGSRLWLLDGAKDTDENFALLGSAGAEALEPFETNLGLYTAVQTARRPGIYGIVATVANTQVALDVAVT